MQQLVADFLAMNHLELVAVALAIAYLLLAVKQSLWCWAAAFVSTAIYLYLFFDARLYMESALQVFYLAMAVYGWQQWRRGGAGGHQLEVTSYSLAVHGVAIVVILALSGLSGYLLESHTEAAFPYLDSFTTWSAVWTTFLVTRKKLENWLYWIVIDGLSIYIYDSRGLALTALLFGLYVVISVFGYISWQKVYRQATGTAA